VDQKSGSRKERRREESKETKRVLKEVQTKKRKKKQQCLVWTAQREGTGEEGQLRKRKA